jgi:hypothetical protein
MTAMRAVLLVLLALTALAFAACAYWPNSNSAGFN